MQAKRVLIAANVIVFIGLAAVMYISTGPSPILPHAQVSVKNQFVSDITPSDKSLTKLWGFIILLQFWLIYTIGFMFRENPTDVLPTRFYVYFMFSSICFSLWFLAWTRAQLEVSLILICTVTLTLTLSLINSSRASHQYLQTLSKDNEDENQPNQQQKFDVAFLFYTQNGISFYISWVIYILCLDLIIYLEYKTGLFGTKTATAVLVLLLYGMLLWFTLQNIVFRDYMRGVFLEYVVSVAAFAGILKPHWSNGEKNQVFIFAILVISVILLVARIIVMLLQEYKIEKRKQRVKPQEAAVPIDEVIVKLSDLPSS